MANPSEPLATRLSQGDRHRQAWASTGSAGDAHLDANRQALCSARLSHHSAELCDAEKDECGAGTAPLERLIGLLRARLNALTHKTPAFAKHDATFILIGCRSSTTVPIWLYQLAAGEGGHRYHQRTIVIALGLTEQL